MRPSAPLLLLAAYPGVAAQRPTLEQFEEAVRLQPTAAGAYSNLGAALRSAGRPEAALEAISTALELNPQYARGYNNLGNALQSLGGTERLEEAVRAHSTAIALSPTLASAYSNLGNALRSLGRPAEAAEALQAAIALDDVNGPAYTNLGIAYAAAGQPTRAVHFSAIGVAMQPASVEAHNAYGAALEAALRPAEAAEAYESGLILSPNSPVLLTNLGGAYKDAGRLNDAIRVLQAALELQPVGVQAARAYNSLGAALQADGQMELALDAYASAVGAAPAVDAGPAAFGQTTGAGIGATAQSNLDKLPISSAYRAAAARESAALARRAASVSLAAWGAARAGQSARRLGLRGSRSGGDLLAVKLHAVIRYLRRLETGQLSPGPAGEPHPHAAALWRRRAGEMPEAIGKSSADGLGIPGDGGGADSPYTLGAFAWGGVWLDSFAGALSHPAVRAALHGATGKKGGGSAVVLGSSLGFEAYAIALSHGIPTVGVEILCSLSELARDIQAAVRAPAELNRFECADALAFSLPKDTRLVYCDDTAWDAHALTALAAKLGDELPPGVAVVHNQPHGFNADGRFRLLQVVEVATSWNIKHPVLVHVTQRQGHGA